LTHGEATTDDIRELAAALTYACSPELNESTAA
jgi:hypothetical protein